MSNSVAIAAVTGTLCRIFASIPQLDPVLSDLIVTVKPPDRAREQDAGPNQLNLFLYQTTPSASWRSFETANEPGLGESTRPPLALNLCYFISAFGLDGDDLLAHRVFGRALSLLHDHPVLTPQEIRQAIVAQKSQQSQAHALTDSDLDQQIEKVHLTYQPLSLEDLAKLLAIFQTRYRISAAYQASVVLIDSTVASRVPPTVLSRDAITGRATPK